MLSQWNQLLQKKKKEKEKKGNNNNVMSTNYDISDFGFDGLGRNMNS